MKFTNGKYSKIIENYHFIPKRGPLETFHPTRICSTSSNERHRALYGRRNKGGRNVARFPQESNKCGVE